MGRLRHRTSPRCTYFITTKTWQNRSLFQVREFAEIVAQRMLSYRDQGAYLLHEFVIMPSHLHLILTPGNSVSLEKAMQLIKGGSSHEIRARRGEALRIWQPGFHEATIRNAAEYETKRAYIWNNPVKARLEERPEEWAFCSASEKYQLDSVPQGLKPPEERRLIVGAKAPTS